MNNNKNKLIAAIVIVLLIIGTIATGVYYNQSINTAQTLEKNTTSKKIELVNNVLTYSGKDNTTALVILQEVATVEMTGTGENAYVTSINGVKASGNQYWELSSNGESASVGAGSLITKNTDTITWKLSSF